MKIDIIKEINVFCSEQKNNPWWRSNNNQHKTIPFSFIKEQLLELFQGESITSITDSVFWRQIGSIRRTWQNNQDNELVLLRGIILFYRTLVRKYPEEALFQESRTFSQKLLHSKELINLIHEDYQFRTFQPGQLYDGHDKVVCIYRNAERNSSRINNDDYTRVDVSEIVSPNYRKVFYNYRCSTLQRLNDSASSALKTCLNILSDYKQRKGEPEYSELVITLQDITVLRTSLNNDKTSQVYVIHFKAFLKWAKDNRFITVDPVCWSSLKTRKNTGNEKQTEDIISNDQLGKILALSKEWSKSQPTLYFVQDATIRLITTTNLRVDAICNLKRDCVITDPIKKNTYKLKYDASKTSQGDIEFEPLSLHNKQLIDSILKYTQPFANNTGSSLADYLLLYIPQKRQSPRIPDAFSIRLYLHALCKELGIPPISAIQCRKAYMTNAKRYVTENKLSDADYLALSGHKHIETTDKHYAKLSIDEYFEALHQVKIDKIAYDIPSLVTRDINAIKNKRELVGDENDKYGYCCAEDCLIHSSLPCFVCEHFVTSKEFLPIFEAMIERTNERIEHSSNPHDKEDQNAIKELLVKYVAEITKTI